jgi:hypothetical protein
LDVTGSDGQDLPIARLEEEASKSDVSKAINCKYGHLNRARKEME